MFTSRFLTEEEWLATFTDPKRNALWMHDGDMSRPHAMIRQNKDDPIEDHTNGFFNARRVLCEPRLVRMAVSDLYAALLAVAPSTIFSTIDWVLGPEKGGITLADNFAALINQRRDEMPDCKAGILEKDANGVLEIRSFEVPEGSNVLVLDDVTATDRTLDESEAAISAKGSNMLRYFLTMVNRTGRKKTRDIERVALVQKQMEVWATRELCPLCRAGSRPVLAKHGHWDELFVRPAVAA